MDGGKRPKLKVGGDSGNECQPSLDAFAPASYSSGVADGKESTKLISESGDAHMTPNDLIFFLA